MTGLKKKARSKKKRSAAPKKLSPWKKFELKVYDDVIAHLVHFSSRPVNTNAVPVGVRIEQKKLPLPYLCVSAVGPGMVKTDYLRNGGSEAGPYKQIRAVLDDRLDEFEKVDQQAVTHIKAACRASGGFEFRTDNIDPRLRQILWPVGGDEYVALTPLPSAGLSQLISERANKVNERAAEESAEEKSPGSKRPLYFPRTKLGIGGANPQNAGGLVYSMNRPFMFSAPGESQSIRRAYAAYYQGIILDYPTKQLDAYGQWLYSTRQQADAKNNLEAREYVQELVQRIAIDILDQANEARSQIADLIRLDGYCSEALPSVQQGLFNPDLRTSRWCSELAMDIARAIGRHKIYVPAESQNTATGNIESDVPLPTGGSEVSVALSDTEVSMIANTIEEVIR